MRDFVGYSNSPPRVVWPNNARLAVCLAVNYEAGAERSVEMGDKTAETYGEFASYGSAPERDLCIESIFEYETRVGIWRILRLLEKHDIKATFFACALSLERNPDAAKQIVEAGHEVCSHGYRWYEHFLFTPEQEREEIRKAVESIRKTTGKRPVGWYCREPGPNTIQLLVEEGGFLYDSDIYNDDLPYFVDVKGKKFLLIPYTPDMNDFHFFSNRFANSEEFYQYLKDSFDTLYMESAENGKIMPIGIHVRISGRPGRIRAVDRFLQYAKGFPDVWFARRVDIAEWWLKNYADLKPLARL